MIEKLYHKNALCDNSSKIIKISPTIPFCKSYKIECVSAQNKKHQIAININNTILLELTLLMRLLILSTLVN